MTSSIITVAPRSSARLVQKQLEDRKRNTRVLSHNSETDETLQPLVRLTPDPSIDTQSTSSTSSKENCRFLKVGSQSAIRTTTSRRGGRFGPGSHHSPRAAALKHSQSQRKKPYSGTGSGSGQKREMPPSATNTPSSAAAAAAAAAKALCDNSNRNRYGAEPYRNYHSEDRQNVFRMRRDDGLGRITTTTRPVKHGIRKPKTSFAKSTMRVMGSHTPTHIPRHHDGRGGYERPRHEPRPIHFSPSGNNPLSVFRDRPMEGPSSELPKNFEETGCTSQQMLLSMKSGSKSFDLDSPRVAQRQLNPTAPKCRENTKGWRRHDGQSPLSPEAPPQIQHSHHEAIKSDALFFNPRTPKTPKTPNGNFKNTDGLQGTPSFSLFDKSFDSFGDSGYLRSPNVDSATLIDQSLPAAFSLAHSYDESPRKKSLASPNPHFFSFSPHKQKSPDLDEFPGGSPTMSLDNVILDTQDAPLMPSALAPKSPAVDPLLSSNVMVLEPSKTVRHIPAPTPISHQSPVKRSKVVPIKKRPTPTPAHYRHPVGHPFRSPHADADRRPRGAPPSIPRQIKSDSPKGQSVHRNPSYIPSHHSIRPTAPHSMGSYGGGHPSPFYRGSRSQNVYVPEKKDTSLAHIDAHQLNSRLSSHRHAFQRCSYLLPGFKKALTNVSDSGGTVTKNEDSSPPSVSPERVESGKEQVENEKTQSSQRSTVGQDKEEADKLIASRRVMSAICAFGGNSSGSGTAKNMKHYKSDISNRYFEHQNRISWDFENDPPVESPSAASNTLSSPSLKRKDEFFGLNANTPKKMKHEDGSGKSNGSEDGVKSTPNGSEAPKMRYRCKLCGQPKQNHKCPYEKSLQRNIGITVHAAINAFTAAEPGKLTPALSEMNNFVMYGEAPENTPARPRRPPIAPVFRGQSLPIRSAPHVTPEAMRSLSQARKGPGYSMPSQGQFEQYGTPGRLMPPTPVNNIRRRRILSPPKNSSSLAVPGHNSDLVFVELNPLRTEQFRVVSARKLSNFQYPQIPLPYPQRKSLSDNLFELSNELPSLKEECAFILRKAREANAWDIAVAELLAQLLVAIHCPAKDTRLEGLSRYLSSLGFSC